MVNGYMLFVKENRDKVVAEYKIKDIKDVARKLGELWRKLSDVEKKDYTDRGALIPKKEKKEKKPKKDDAPKAKRPLSNYMKFVQENRKKVTEANKSLKATEVVSKLGAMWRELSDEQKSKYK
jgi:hypothetical protein